jgi:tetratricopeptide (TPR) repeat protein
MRAAAGKGVQAGLVLVLTVVSAAGPVCAAPSKIARDSIKSSAAEAKDPFSRGVERFKQEKLDEALAAFKEAELKEPKDAIIQSWIGYVSFRLGKYDDAIKYLKSSLELVPNNPDTSNNLGNAYLAKGDVEHAVEAYQRTVDLVKGKPGNHADPYYNLGNALVKKGDLENALAAFLEAEKQDPNDPLIQNNLGFVYERKHTLNADANPIAPAVEHYRKAVEKQPSNAIFQRNLGLAARKQPGAAAEALRALKRAIQLDPKDYSSHLALAEEYQNGKQLDAAAEEYRQAAALKPNEFIPRYNLGLLYAKQARDTGSATARKAKYNLAISQLRQAAKLRPSDHRPLGALGWVNFNAGNLTEAANWYQKAIQAEPTLQSAHANLGLVMDRLKQPDRAIKHWRDAVKLEPTDVATRSLLASAYLNKQQWTEAAAEYREIVRQDPKDARSFNNLGYALEKLGKLDEAVATYKQAIELEPRLAVAHNNLGACYERQGQKDLARQCYLKARQVDPNFEDAKKNLQRLGG